MVNNSVGHSHLRQGFSILDKHANVRLQKEPLFNQGKTGDYFAATRLIEQLWTDEKTEELRQLILPERPPIFFSVPSTSRTNQVPIAYARFLAQQTQDFGATFLVGDEHISSLHTSMMKSLNKGSRMMAPRLYETFRATFFDNLRKHTQNSSVVLVEDIITTGASVNTFKRFLEHNGVEVDCIAGIKGDPHLEPAESDLQKLEKTAQKAGLDMGLDWMALGRELTNSEVQTLWSSYINVQYKNADEQSKLLMRRQLYYLYALKVCQRTEVSTKINKLTQLLNRRGEKSYD